MKLTPGQDVKVFEDPITCNTFEGTAKLIELYRGDRGDNLSLWSVRFLSDGFETLRTINSDTAVK